MTPATDILTPARGGETRLVASVCFAHMVSHYNMVLLAPLFVFIRADYGVSYTQLGLAFTAFNAVSMVVQTPMGFFIDRTDPRRVLISGLLLASAAIAVAGIVHSYWVFVAMFALMGVSNTVFHPADYTLLSESVPSRRLTQVFSYHTCAGMLGSAVAPPTLLFMENIVGWRGAFLGAAVPGILAAIALALPGELPVTRPREAKARRAAEADAPNGWRLLLSAPILLNLAFFFALSLVSFGLSLYLVVGLQALNATPAAIANAALTGLLTLTAVGVLAGGWIAARTARHNLVTAIGLLATGATTAFVALVDTNAALLVVIMSLSGFASGITMPSRDMIVRSVTPRGSFGKVFAFVTTGFHIGGMISPLIFGQFLDHGAPRGMFLFIAACAVAAVGTVCFGMPKPRTA